MTRVGWHHSEETLAKLRKPHKKGQVPWNKGLRGIYSAETRQKMSLGRKGKPGTWLGKKGSLSHLYGKKWSDEEIKKRTESRKKNEKPNPLKGVPRSEETKRKVSLALTGIKRSAITKAKISLANQKRFGTTGNNKRRKNDRIYAAWRDAVYEKDDFVCFMCDKRGGKLHAHHVLPYAKYPEHRLNIDNGVTLCIKCHHKIHGWKTKEDGLLGDLDI